MTILQIAVILLLFHRALRIHPEPVLQRIRSRRRSQ
jgi:hypothetical protein